ncbi:hypothetical protein GCM10009662_54060 [Catellatospora coxensis]|uniref:Uncharacterized protein n=1 Tax=Catellatospora coxensis TaxID=310354 RepID=A0A8J3L6W4_9ACTN|nr:hypothetical protein Cco03nite_69690 [Catellatospora coxensis]
MAPPKTHPDDRAVADVVPTDVYAPHDRVWVYRDGQWRAGIVYDASSHAATVICCSSTARGTEVEIRTARYVARRDLIDLSIDALSYV